MNVSSGRRLFFAQVIRLLQAGLALFLAIPVVRYILYPILETRASDGMWSSAGNVSEIPIGEPQKRTFLVAEHDGWSERRVERSVWVVRYNEDRAAVYNALCPHQGCAINWKAEAQSFKCPCHESSFNLDGGVTNGPSPRGLDKLEYKTDSGVLLVKYQNWG
jgi:Rieske Fe-S protein